MTNVSKTNTQDKDFISLYTEFSQAIAVLTKASAYYFFDELFTESEKIMFIKRFSALMLFKENYSAYKVAAILHMSPTTAHKLYDDYQDNAYQHITNTFSKKELPAILSFIEKFIRSQGKERWLLQRK